MPWLGLNAMEPGTTLPGPEACTAQDPQALSLPVLGGECPSRGCASGFCFLPLGSAETRTLVRKYPGELVFSWTTTRSQPGPGEHRPPPELQAQACSQSWDTLDPAQATPPVYLGLFYSVGDPQAVPGHADCCCPWRARQMLCCFPRASSQSQGLALNCLGGRGGGCFHAPMSQDGGGSRAFGTSWAHSL